jgi:23S rRNA pseudouridine1911/1915/1917 synthase
MDIPILFEDDTLVVVNKPPGIVVNRAQSVKDQTVQDWAHTYLHIEAPAVVPKAVINDDGSVIRDIEAEFASRAGIVHRIDKETSGCLVIAKTASAFDHLQRQFKERTIQKAYLAIVHGEVAPEKGEVRAPVGRLPWSPDHFGILPGGKEAVTEYFVHRSWMRAVGKLRDPFSLIELHPLTGRTHQIRVHMKHINHPLLADYLYAGRKVARADRLWAPRIMLHAWKIQFLHPTTGSTLALEAPIPDDMESIMQ